MKDLTFENVEAPPDYYGGKRRSRVTGKLKDAPVGQWIKISGFESYDQANKCRNTIRSGRRSITEVLKKDGIKIHRENPADLIITDLIMPEKEGLETIMELRRDFHDVKIIAMSGGGKIDSETYLQIAKTMGAISTIAKPFGRKELLRTVQELLE